MSNPFDQQKEIPGVKNIIAISSGKGGVGKSTMATHLALALHKKGYKVGLLDADIYGPSIPRMMGTMNQKPAVVEGRIQPLDVAGVKTMSMGNLVDEDLAVVWRGPMLFKAMNQFLFEVDWGELDFLLIDLPPGTGDVQLSLAQKVPMRGAVTVTTPQNIALADVKKAIDMFKRVNIPVLGVIENMAYFESPETREKIQMFPKGELAQYLDKEKIKKIGEVPLNPYISQSCEVGVALYFKADHPVSQKFMEIADNLLEQLIQ
jgi:ATP-binding protein involved in chromosome partitioning